ncbi:hypothetical protein [Mucilaginibacter sp. UYCu711]|uniref:hypothetical protein n=1 Tax=Mucilaginibacter sp. UYCu711 TaxID=3156339 RepID=UPI003D209EA3
MMIKVITFLGSMIITIIIFVLVKIVFFKEDLTRSLIFAIPAGLGAAIGTRLYVNYLKRKRIKQSSKSGK